jgi:hypothetical protein
MRMRTLIGTTTVAALTALPLAAQTQSPASALESERTWNRLAECESGQDWDTNTGNGYYGGLQISMDTWKAFRGRWIADRPDQASKAGQIKVAERILNDQGWGAWPSCSQQIGVA